jgi:hypothetical protein
MFPNNPKCKGCMSKKKYKYGMSKKFPQTGYETRTRRALRLLRDDSLSKIHYVGTVSIEKDKMSSSMKRRLKMEKKLMNSDKHYNETKHLSGVEYTRSVLDDMSYEELYG